MPFLPLLYFYSSWEFRFELVIVRFEGLVLPHVRQNRVIRCGWDINFSTLRFLGTFNRYLGPAWGHADLFFPQLV